MYERITDAWNSLLGRKSIFVIVEHNVEKTRDIVLKNQRVVNVYYKGYNYEYNVEFGVFILSLGYKWDIDIFKDMVNTMGAPDGYEKTKKKNK